MLMSCGEENHPDADSLCKCFTELHRTNTVEQTNRIADSCNSLYSTILEKYKNDEEGKATFNAAYKNCQ